MPGLRKLNDVIKHTRSSLPAAPETSSGAALTELAASTEDDEPAIASALDCDDTAQSKEGVGEA